MVTSGLRRVPPTSGRSAVPPHRDGHLSVPPTDPQPASLPRGLRCARCTASEALTARHPTRDPPQCEGNRGVDPWGPSHHPIPAGLRTRGLSPKSMVSTSAERVCGCVRVLGHVTCAHVCDTRRVACAYGLCVAGMCVCWRRVCGVPARTRVWCIWHVHTRAARHTYVCGMHVCVVCVESVCGTCSGCTWPSS